MGKNEIKERISKQLRHNPLTWKHVINRSATKSFKKETLSDAQSKVVQTLQKDGIAFSQFEELFPQLRFEDFRQKVLACVSEYEQGAKAKEHDLKSYFNFVLGLKPTFDKHSEWNQVASNPVIQQISDAYFQMKNTEMRYYNIWKHEASGESPKGSQLWHRDREDLKILKVFVCIEDVNENTGPFTYAPSTHLDGRIAKEPEHIVESDGTERTTDEMMNKLVPKEKWIKALGKKGTVVFADTHGYHKGGEVKEGYRLLFTAMYVSPRCLRNYFKN